MIDVNLKEVEISNRALYPLLRSGINTISDLMKYSYYDLYSIDGLGKKGIQELQKVLKYKYGIILRK